MLLVGAPPWAGGASTSPALTTTWHVLQRVDAQQLMVGGDEAAAAALLSEVPLRGRVVSLDAGLMERPVVKTVVKKRGTYVGLLEAHQPEVKKGRGDVDGGVLGKRGGCPQPDDVMVNKGHGRIERRELWWVEARELGSYLAQEYDWPGVTACGWIRRVRRRVKGRRNRYKSLSG